MTPISERPSLLPAGQRQDALNRLAKKVELLSQQGRSLSYFHVYENPWPNATFNEALAILEERQQFLNPFDFPRAATLLDSDPALFSESDFNLAVRGLWKSDRVGFYKGGDELFRNGYIAKMIRCWDCPQNVSGIETSPDWIQAWSDLESGHPWAPNAMPRVTHPFPAPNSRAAGAHLAAMARRQDLYQRWWKTMRPG
jgi:hypothetical protein